MVMLARRRMRVDWSSIPIHPFLVAAYPIVFLFAANADEQVTLDPLWTPLAMALGATAVVLVALALLLRDWLRAAPADDRRAHRFLRIRARVECRIHRPRPANGP